VIVGVIRRKPVLTHASIVCESMQASVNSVNSVNNNNNNNNNAPGGCEAAIHSGRRHLEALSADQCSVEFHSSTPTAILLIVIRQRCFMAHTSSRLRKVPNRVTRWARYCSVTPFSLFSLR